MRSCDCLQMCVVIIPETVIVDIIHVIDPVAGFVVVYCRKCSLLWKCTVECSVVCVGN